MRTILSVLALTAALAAAPAPAGAAPHRKPCHRPHTTTVAHSSLARVFERSGGPGADYDTRLLGCLRGRDRVIRLAEAYDDDLTLTYGYDHVGLSGRYAAWASYYSDSSCKAACPPDYEPDSYSVTARNLRGNSRGVETSDKVRKVLISRRGALVWSQGSGASAELWALDSRGRRQLDTGSYAVRSVRLGAKTVTWRHGGTDRSAPVGHW